MKRRAAPSCYVQQRGHAAPSGPLGGAQVMMTDHINKLEKLQRLLSNALNKELEDRDRTDSPASPLLSASSPTSPPRGASPGLRRWSDSPRGDSSPAADAARLMAVGS